MNIIFTHYLYIYVHFFNYQFGCMINQPYVTWINTYQPKGVFASFLYFFNFLCSTKSYFYFVDLFYGTCVWCIYFSLLFISRGHFFVLHTYHSILKEKIPRRVNLQKLLLSFLEFLLLVLKTSRTFQSRHLEIFPIFIYINAE